MFVRATVVSDVSWSCACDAEMYILYLYQPDTLLGRKIGGTLFALTRNWNGGDIGGEFVN